MQLNLFRTFAENPSTEEEKMSIVWEFLRDSIQFINESSYKSVGKHMIAAWEKEMLVKGYIKSIKQEIVKLTPQKNSCCVLIEFPFKGKKHITIWLDNAKSRLEDLMTYLQIYEQKALNIIRNEEK